jgi:hypothetical protein
MPHRNIVGIVLLLISGSYGTAQQTEEPPIRYGVHPRLEDYPQATAKEALASVLNALEQNQVAYVLAQLTDPGFVDRRVQDLYGGNFDELVRETTTKLADNPGTIKELRRFLMEGEWQANGNSASAKLKDVKDRQVFVRKMGTRWFLENRQK